MEVATDAGVRATGWPAPALTFGPNRARLHPLQTLHHHQIDRSLFLLCNGHRVSGLHKQFQAWDTERVFPVYAAGFRPGMQLMLLRCWWSGGVCAQSLINNTKIIR